MELTLFCTRKVRQFAQDCIISNDGAKNREPSSLGLQNPHSRLFLFTEPSTVPAALTQVSMSKDMET